MYMVGEGHVEVEDQYGKSVPLSNEKIDAKKYDNCFADIFQRGIKEKKSTKKKALKERLKVAMKNRVRNFTMAESKNIYLVHFP